MTLSALKALLIASKHGDVANADLAINAAAMLTDHAIASALVDDGMVALATNAESLTGTSTTLATTPSGVKDVVSQPAVRSVTLDTDTVLAGDIGNVVYIETTTPFLCEVALNSLASELLTGRLLMLTWQCTDESHVLTINPGTSVKIDGVSDNFVAATGKARVSLMSIDGLKWFSGATP